VTAVRVAAIDMGTNSTRLLVADVEDGGLREIERLLAITRLGDGVDANGCLADAAMDRVERQVSAYVTAARRLRAERVVAVATSAARDAENGDLFLAGLSERLELECRLLSGEDEARLTFRGVTSSIQATEGTLLCDIGGGSTELVLGDEHGIGSQTSLALGCVRMSERHLTSDPPTPEQLAELRAGAAAMLPAELCQSARLLVGVAGTVTTLATIDLGLDTEIPEVVDRHRLGSETVERLLRELAALPLERRRAVRGLMPERAPTIVAGAAILAELLRACPIKSLVVSERDILHGVALAAADT
jgi:exopolyphosphatase/guanosine-5'-triphosphate,3'-diphosphate pyrophosphatase